MGIEVAAALVVAVGRVAAVAVAVVVVGVLVLFEMPVVPFCLVFLRADLDCFIAVVTEVPHGSHNTLLLPLLPLLRVFIVLAVGIVVVVLLILLLLFVASLLLLLLLVRLLVMVGALVCRSIGVGAES